MPCASSTARHAWPMLGNTNHQFRCGWSGFSTAQTTTVGSLSMAKKHLIEFSPLYAAWPSYPIFLAESLSTRKFRDEAIERNANSWFLLVLELELIIGLSHALESIESLSVQSLSSVVSRQSNQSSRQNRADECFSVRPGAVPSVGLRLGHESLFSCSVPS